MKSHCDIWELRNQWVTQSSGLSIVDPALTIYAMASYATESGKIRHSWTWTSFPCCVCSRCRTPTGTTATDTLGSGMINNYLFQSLYVCLLLFIFADSHTHFLWKDGQRMKERKSYAYFEAVFIAWKREWKRARHLYHSNEGALIIGPWRCLSRQPFPGTLLEMSTNGNWIHLAVGVQPPLTDAHTAEMLKWQMFPRLLKPECIAMTSRYRLSDAVWAVWQSRGLLKSESEQVGRGDWCWRKAWGCLFVCLFVGVSGSKSCKRFTFPNSFGCILT